MYVYNTQEGERETRGREGEQERGCTNEEKEESSTAVTDL